MAKPAKPSKDYLLELLRDVLEDKKSAIIEANKILIEQGLVVDPPLSFLGEPK